VGSCELFEKPSLNYSKMCCVSSISMLTFSLSPERSPLNGRGDIVMAPGDGLLYAEYPSWVVGLAILSFLDSWAVK
jgi:hypothetical protein